MPKKHKGGPFGLTSTFGSIKNCGLVRESNPRFPVSQKVSRSWINEQTDCKKSGPFRVKLSAEKILPTVIVGLFSLREKAPTKTATWHQVSISAMFINMHSIECWRYKNSFSSVLLFILYILFLVCFCTRISFLGSSWMIYNIVYISCLGMYSDAGKAILRKYKTRWEHLKSIPHLSLKKRKVLKICSRRFMKNWHKSVDTPKKCLSCSENASKVRI